MTEGETFNMLFLGPDSATLVNIFEPSVLLKGWGFEMVAENRLTVLQGYKPPK